MKNQAQAHRQSSPKARSGQSRPASPSPAAPPPPAAKASQPAPRLGELPPHEPGSAPLQRCKWAKEVPRIKRNTFAPQVLHVQVDFDAWWVLRDQAGGPDGLTAADLVLFAICDKLNLYPDRVGSGPDPRPLSADSVAWMHPPEAGRPRQTYLIACALELETFDPLVSAAEKIGLTVEQFISCAVAEKAIIYQQASQPSTQDKGAS